MTYNIHAEKRFSRKGTNQTKQEKDMTALTMVQKRQEAARAQKAAIQEKMGRRERTTRIPDGRSRWRVLPSWRGADDINIAHAFGQHFVKDAAGDLKAVHMCLDKTYGKYCPICNALQIAIKNSNDETQKILEESKSGSRFLLNAYQVVKDKTPEVVILETPPSVFEMINDLIDQKADDQEVEDEDGNLVTEPGVDMLDVKKGFDIIITKSGKGLNTKYTVLPASTPTRVPPALLENLNDLDAYVKQEHAETELKALNVLERVSTGRALPNPNTKTGGLDLDDDDILDGEFEEAPAPKAKPKAAAKPKPKVVDEEEEDDASVGASDEEIDDLMGELDDLDLD